MGSRDTFKDFADQHRPLIDSALALRLDSLDSHCPKHLIEAMRYSLLSNGKRIRPLLVLMAAEACGGTIESAMSAACAIEMVHVYSLIHDDLPAMDDDDLRRGQPTCHIKFGEAEAILAGDALLTLAFETLTEIRPEKIAVECVKILASASGAAGMVGGQSDDLKGEKNEQTVEQLESIDRRKTGALLVAAVHMGATIADASIGQLNALKKYAECIGLAFQIRDDLLDLESGDIGKATLKDQKHGKLTYPGLLGEERARLKMRQLIDEAIAAVSMFKKPDCLKDLARFVAERSK